MQIEIKILILCFIVFFGSMYYDLKILKKKCPYCDSRIGKKAIICPHCNKELDN